ncbi:hypothetical protein [Kineosporia sp. NBRC 101731]|nr:hypothetical protein [Kineosporia sp. NBRC 101731]GLY32054.1 hypothetical protein Kisp02_54190 [Kineosporia sp. NBRC 101731]
MIHRIGRRIVISNDSGETHPEDIFRDFVDRAALQLEYIPRQRSA